jgi:hypothetical protein
MQSGAGKHEAKLSKCAMTPQIFLTECRAQDDPMAALRKDRVGRIVNAQQGFTGFAKKEAVLGI